MKTNYSVNKKAFRLTQRTLMSNNNDRLVNSNKDLAKRLKLVRSRLRKLEDIDEESTFTEDEEAELAYMKEVVKLVISNGTMDACTAEDNSTVTSKELDDFVEDMYDISSVLYHVRIFLVLITMRLQSTSLCWFNRTGLFRRLS